MRLRDRVVLVTGASKGIGAEVAMEAAREGADVIIDYATDRAGAQAVLAGVEKLGRRGIVVRADVSVKADVDALVAQGIERFGKIDILINNAGIALWKPFLEKTEDEWDRTLNVNLKGVFLCTQAVARHLVEKSLPGSVVNMSSIAAYGTLDCLVDYCASKGGMTLATKAMATELGPYGIRVNTVAPGNIDVKRNRDLDPNFLDSCVPFTPLGRVGKVSDIAKAVIFLASDDAEYITGQIIWVDGGLTTYVPMPRVGFVGKG